MSYTYTVFSFMQGLMWQQEENVNIKSYFKPYLTFPQDFILTATFFKNNLKSVPICHLSLKEQNFLMSLYTIQDQLLDLSSNKDHSCSSNFRKTTLACMPIHLAAAGTTSVSGQNNQNTSRPQNCIHQHISKAICTALFKAEEN